jgi:hypothetical protein
MHIGTTALAINRASAALTLTGVSIDGNAGTVTNGVYTTGGQTIAGTTTVTDLKVNGILYLPNVAGDPAPYITARTVPTGQGNANERTELIIFHSNDGDNGSGVDTITLRAPGLRFQTYSDAAVSDINNNAGANDRLYISPTGAATFNSTVSSTGFSGPLTGNATTATTLQTARNINGTSFNGGADITTANWGTARTLTIGSTGKSVNGSAAVSWTLAEIGAAAIAQTMHIGTTALAINRASAALTLTGVSIDGNAGTAGGLSVHAGRNNEANKIVRTDGNGYIQAGWINTPSGDSGNTVPNKFYSSNDDYIRFYTRNTYKMHIGLTAKYDRGRVQDTTDTNYWVGTMGWGTTDWNVVGQWGSGFVDSWSSPANRPGDSTHHVGIQAFHYSAGANVANGWQLVGGPTDTWSIRRAWSTWGSWFTLLHSGNYNSFSPTLTGGGASGTWGINVTGSSGSCTGNAATATTLQTARNINNVSFNGSAAITVNGLNYNVNNAWFRYLSDGATVRLYGNSRQMVFRTDGTTEYSTGIGAFPFVWMYGGDAAGNRQMYIDASSNLSVINNITAYASDERLKENVHRIDNAIAKVCALNGVVFDWKEHIEGFKPDVMKGDVGFIAQNVQSVLPIATTLAPFDTTIDARGNKTSLSGNNYLTVRHEKIVPLLVEAIKDLKKEKDAEIASIREENRKLRADVDRLMAIIGLAPS